MASDNEERNGPRAQYENADVDAHEDSNDDAESGTSSSGVEEDGEEESVEWLATGRAKRSTAGNRMKSMLANEEPVADDSDLELLFAEGDDDVAFSDAERDDGSDAHMESSSSDEDENEAADDMAGEKELERQAREKRMAARKRKAQEAIPVKFRKKARIRQPPESDTGATTPAATAPAEAPPPRPKKKSERTSWLPSAGERPTRASERATTKLSKEQLHQQMEERESRRMRLLEIQEKKAKKLAALKKPPMTQAERLAEAALVEKRNAKSLNRWEEAEKQREEERLAKLAALHNRKLSGPVVTFWSGIQELEGQDEQMKHVGKMVSIEEKPKKKKESKLAMALAAAKVQDAAAATDSAQPTAPGTPSKPASEAPTPQVSTPPATTNTEDAHSKSVLEDASGVASSEEASELQTSIAEHMPAQAAMAPPPAPQPPEVRGVSDVLAAPVLAPPSSSSGTVRLPGSSSLLSSASNGLAHPDTARAQSPLGVSAPAADITAEDSGAASSAANQSTSSMAPPPPPLPLSASQQTQPAGATKEAGRDTPTAQPLEEKFTRSCIILQNFDEDAIKDKHVQTQILFGRKMNKQSKPAHPPPCLITGQPAQYKDPKTGLPYFNSYAYKEIQKLQRGEYKWSRLVGAWMGIGTYAARGVPKGFLDAAELEAAAEEAKQGEGGEAQQAPIQPGIAPPPAGAT